MPSYFPGTLENPFGVTSSFCQVTLRSNGSDQRMVHQKVDTFGVIVNKEKGPKSELVMPNYTPKLGRTCLGGLAVFVEF